MIVNLFGAPGAGKSTTRAGVFHRLKLAGHNVEEVPEFAKDLTWEKRGFAIGCQPYVFGKQLRNLTRVKDQVDIIVTDSPILLSSYYGEKYGEWPPSFHDFVLAMHHRMGEQMSYYIRRVKPFNPAGRNQTAEQSDAIGEELHLFLRRKGIVFQELDGNEDAVARIVRSVGYVSA